MVDGRVVAADFAGCTLLHLDGAEVHRLGIEGEQSVGEQIAYTEEVLQSLCCLNGSEHTGDGSQNASLTTGRNCACWRWFLEEATVTCRAWQVGKGLSLESQDAAMREGFAQTYAGIIDKELYREVVCSVDNEIPWLDDFLGIVRIEEVVISGHFHIRIDGNHLLLGALHLWSAQVLGLMNHLALQVAEVYHVSIHDTDMSHTCCSEVEGNWRAQATGTYDEYLGIEKFLLTFESYILKEDVAAVSLYLFFC